MDSDVFDGYGVSIVLPKYQNFTMIKETLTRIGYPSKEGKTLFQTCHIFHKRGQYAIMHFKEMYHFDHKNVDISDEDIEKRNSIAQLLEEWNLLEIDEELDTEFNLKEVKVVPHKEKNDWNLVPKYIVGSKRQK